MPKVLQIQDYQKAIPLFLLLMISQAGIAQTTAIPRDTTYTIRSAYEKIKKDYPFVKPIEEETSGRVRFQKEVVYAKSNGRELHLDVFYPARKRKKKYPGVLMIHGGGWSSGSKAHQVPMARQLAKKGYVAVAVAYRLSPEAPYPAGMLDVKAAVRWMRARADDYGLDADQIAALGCSSGAQMASLLGTTGGTSLFKDSTNNPSYSSRVQAVVNIDGIVSFIHPEAAAEGKAAGRWLGGSRAEAAENWRSASPLEYADEKTPPFLFVNSSIPRFHAGRDDLINVLKRHGIYYKVHTLSDSPHSFWLVHPWYKETLKYVKVFLKRVFD